MSDTECNLEELTALLDDDDDHSRDDIVTSKTSELERAEKEGHKNKVKEDLEKVKLNKDEECSFEELSMMLGESDEDSEAPSKDSKNFDNTEDFIDEKAVDSGGSCGDANGGKGERCKNEETEDQFDDFYDSDMEEMVKSMETQSEHHSVNTSLNSEGKHTNSGKTYSKNGIDLNKESDQSWSKDQNVDQSGEKLMNQSEAGIEDQSDSESSESSEDWFDKVDSQKPDADDSASGAEQTGSTETTDQTLSQADILAEMEMMAQRMEQLKAMLIKKNSPCGSPVTAATKTKNKRRNSEKTQNQENKTKSVACEQKKENSTTKNLDNSSKISTESLEKLKSKSSDDDCGKREKETCVKLGNITKEGSSKMREKEFREKLKSKIVEDCSKKTDQESIDKLSKTVKDPSSSGKKEKFRNHQKRKRSADKNEKDEDNPFFAEPQSAEDSLPSADPRSLFGDSDDSDWEEMDGEKKSNLSDEGRQIKKLLNNGPRQRVAHTPSYDPAVLKKSPPTRWTDHSASPAPRPVKMKPVVDKPQLNPGTGTVSGKYTLRDEYKTKPVNSQLKDVDEKEFATDPYCGIRIINPRISMSEFKLKMSGRALIKVSNIHHKVGKGDLQKDNWVTIGVVVHRTEPRQSASGKSFCIWKLSDLQDCDKTVSFFLFGTVYKEHWKNELGTVIGLLNPSMMDKAEKVQSELAFTVSHPQQLLVMGISKDLGRCKGTTKAGNPCSHFINKYQGEFCTYHVQAAYKKSSAKRTELQASTGITPKAFSDKGKRGSKDSCFFYGGQTYTTMKPQAKSSKDQVTLKKLQHAEANKGAMKVTTMSLHELEPDDEKKFKKLEEKDAALLEKLMVPTAGSMNLVKHLVKKDKPKQTDSSKSDQPEFESVSAKDLLKQHQNVMKQRIADRKKLASTPTLGKGFSSGQDISLDVPVKKSSTLSADLAKNVAIAKLKEKGGVKKEDPNIVKKKIMSPEQKEKIRKRVAEDLETDSKEPDPESSEPPRKRSKFLGNVDLNDPEVQKLLKSKSKHKGALAEAEAEHEEKYFMALEKKEKMEEKMDSVMEVEVKLFKCKQCAYKAFSLSDRCKKENHKFKVVSGMKRFFKCKQCKRRMVSIEKFPTVPCKDCGASSFIRVSMLKERSGPKLESEELSLRGNEQKYLGSLNQKSYLNL